jgi:type III pantothenate kinase
MILCVDSGNTRIKWGLREGERWLSEGALPQAEIGRLEEQVRGLPAPGRIMVANVAGPGAAEAIEKALAPWRERLHFVQSQARGGGVANGYADPARLGVDRWCALVGARHRVRSDCLVVGAGTATTVDTLDADGRFLGGLILPGFDLMRQALARNTAGLPLARGRHEEFPRCTDDAIFSGCLEAQVGAVERAFGRIADRPGAQCLVFGGAAPILMEHLNIPCRRVDTLVLDGLFHLA